MLAKDGLRQQIPWSHEVRFHPISFKRVGRLKMTEISIFKLLVKRNCTETYPASNGNK